MEIDSIMDTNWFDLVSCHLLFISYNNLAFIKNSFDRFPGHISEFQKPFTGQNDVFPNFRFLLTNTYRKLLVHA